MLPSPRPGRRRQSPTATAVNVVRVAAWLEGMPQAQTRGQPSRHSRRKGLQGRPRACATSHCPDVGRLAGGRHKAGTQPGFPRLRLYQQGPPLREVTGGGSLKDDSEAVPRDLEDQPPQLKPGHPEDRPDEILASQGVGQACAVAGAGASGVRVRGASTHWQGKSRASHTGSTDGVERARAPGDPQVPDPWERVGRWTQEGRRRLCGGTPLESGLWPREREVCRYDHEGVRPTTGRQVTMSTQGGLARERSSAGFTQIWLAPCRQLCAANQQRTLAQILNCIPCACRLQLCLIGLSEPARAVSTAIAHAPQRT